MVDLGPTTLAQVAASDPMKMARRKAEKLLNKKNVVGVSIGFKEVGGKRTNEIGIVVHVREKVGEDTLPKSQLVPKTIRGVRTDVQQTGEIWALGLRDRRMGRPREERRYRMPVGEPVSAGDPTARVRPVPPGVSIGEESITAGTSGIYLRMRHLTQNGDVDYMGPWELYGNAHVQVPTAQLPTGDAKDCVELQPGSYHGGHAPTDVTGKLLTYTPIIPTGAGQACGKAQVLVDLLNTVMEWLGRDTRFGMFRSLASEPENTVDGSLQLMTDQSLVQRAVYGLNIVPGPMVDLALGDVVVTSNWRTGIQSGTVVGVGYSGVVNYGDFNALFTDQIVVDGAGFSDGGSSGGIVMRDGSSQWGGNLFAGGSGKTIVNKSRLICERFGVTCE